MRRIATLLLALLLIAGQHARAADTKGMITLSCEGTVRSGPGPGDVERVNERVIFVNLAEHTVTGFVTNTGSALTANIVHVDDTSVDFIGDFTLSSVFGTSIVSPVLRRYTRQRGRETRSWVARSHGD